MRDPGIYYVESPGAGGIIASTRLDPVMKSRVQEVVQCGKFPFDSENKLIRTAVHYFMETVIGAKMHATFRDDLKLVRMQQNILRATARLADVKKFVLSTAEALHSLYQAGQLDEARNIWHHVNVTMARMDEPYRSMYRAAFKGNSYAEWNAVRDEMKLRVMEAKSLARDIES